MGFSLFSVRKAVAETRNQKPDLDQKSVQFRKQYTDQGLETGLTS